MKWLDRVTALQKRFRTRLRGFVAPYLAGIQDLVLEEEFFLEIIRFFRFPSRPWDFVRTLYEAKGFSELDRWKAYLLKMDQTYRQPKQTDPNEAFYEFTSIMRKCN